MAVSAVSSFVLKSNLLIALYHHLSVRVFLQLLEERELRVVGFLEQMAILDTIALLSNLRQERPSWYRAGLQPKLGYADKSCSVCGFLGVWIVIAKISESH